MALRAGYYGLKNSLLNKVKGLPGIKSIGSGLNLDSTTGELTASGTNVYKTDDATESAIVDADYVPFFDSSAASGEGAPKKSTWSNFKTKIFIPTRLGSGDDLNDYRVDSKVGIYDWNDNHPVNSPFNYGWCTMLVLRAGGVWKQVVFYGPNTICMREYAGTPPAWTAWKTIL